MQTRTIAFANQKGGVGKTTSAVNLAAALAERGKRVLLIDLDPQTNATSALGIESTPGASLYTALLGENAPVAEKIAQTAFRHLDVIPSEIDLAGAEVEMARRDHYLHCLYNILAPLQKSARYAFIILDCPPSLGILTMNALAAAQGLIVPSQCEYLALEGLSVITRLVNRLRENGANPRLHLDGILMTMYDARTRLGAQVIAEVRRHFDHLVFNTIIPRNIRLSEAPSFGQPVLKYDPSSPGAKAYRALSNELLRRLKNPHASESQTQNNNHAPQIIISKPLTRQERLRRCFSHEELDRPAIYSRTGFPANDPSYDRLKALLAEHTEQKTHWNGLLLNIAPDDVMVEPHSENFERRIIIKHTPKGDLRKTVLRGLKGFSGMTEAHFINTPEDIEKYMSLPEPEIGGNFNSFFDALAAIGETGIVDVSLGLNPAGLAADLCGSDNFALLSTTNRDDLFAICERRMNLVLRLLNYLLERKIGPYFSMSGEEYVAPPLHSPEDFNDFNLRYDKPIADKIHEAGCRLHIHCHGRLKKIMRSFLELGPDVLHPIEPPPMGDITAAEAKAILRDQICIEGNLQIAAMYENTPAQIAEETKTLIADAFGDRKNLIVSPSASPYIHGQGEACLEQYRAMIETVLNWTQK